MLNCVIFKLPFATQIRTAVFWDTSQRVVVIPSWHRYVVPKGRYGINTTRCVIAQKTEVGKIFDCLLIRNARFVMHYISDVIL